MPNDGGCFGGFFIFTGQLSAGILPEGIDPRHINPEVQAALFFWGVKTKALTFNYSPFSTQLAQLCFFV